MQIEVSTRHGSLSEGTQEKITAKVEKLTRLFDRLSSIEVTVDLEHEGKPSVEILVAAEHKHDFVARFEAEDLMAAVDQAVHKLEHQIRKYKEKIQDRHRGADL